MCIDFSRGKVGEETIPHLYWVLHLGVWSALCPMWGSKPVGTRYREGGNHRVTKAYHYSQAKRETVVAQVVSILETTTLSTWLWTVSLHCNEDFLDGFGMPCVNTGVAWCFTHIQWHKTVISSFCFIFKSTKMWGHPFSARGSSCPKYRDFCSCSP